MQNMEALGVPRRIVAFVLPTGYTFNLDGTTLYLSVASIFVAQAAGIHLTLGNAHVEIGQFRLRLLETRTRLLNIFLTRARVHQFRTRHRLLITLLGGAQILVARAFLEQ